MSAQQLAPYFLFSQHAHLPLPRKRTDARSFELRVGRAHMRIEAGSVFCKGRYIDKPLPYGRYARLCLIYLNTTAIRKKTKEICLGDSITDFVRTLIGRNPNGDDLRSFHQQFDALEGATLKIGFENDIGENIEVKMHLANQIKRSPCAGGKGEKVMIILADDYFAHLQAHALPLSLTCVFALAGKPLALDIFCWLSARLCTIKQEDGQFITWAALHKQFGVEYGEIRCFRRKFLIALEFALAQYPAAKIKIESDKRPAGHPAPRGLRLFNSPALVQKKESGK